MEIRNLTGLDFDTIYLAFGKAFSDYAVTFDKSEVRSMLKRRGFKPELSFAAFHNGDIVAFTFNGIGMFNGALTAYDTGTGTVKEYRGKGLAQDIFRHSIPYLREAGVKQYLLEVLQDNAKAISVYQKLGFATTRRLRCFRQPFANIRQSTAHAPAEAVGIAPVSIDVIADASTAFADFGPSWQNSLQSITRAGDDLCRLGAYLHGNLAGYCIFDPLTGDLTQLAVGPEYRRMGIASRLLHECVKRMHCSAIKVLNIQSTDTTLPAFLAARNIAPAADQYEMILKI